MRFTWDPAKNARNVVRHAIDFADAVRIFDGFTLERIDDRVDYGEERTVAIGLIAAGEVTVVYTERGADTYRIISARKATDYERKAYWRARRG